MCSDVVAALRNAQPDSAGILEYRHGRRPEAAAEARAAGAGARRGIEPCAVGLAFDFALRVEELSVADIHGLRPVGAHVDPGAEGAVGRAMCESLLGVRARRRGGKADLSPLGKLLCASQAHQTPFHGPSGPPAPRLAARAMMKS